MSFPIEENGTTTHSCERGDPCMHQTDTGLHQDGTPCKYATHYRNYEAIRGYEAKVGEPSFFAEWTMLKFNFEVYMGFKPSAAMAKRITDAMIDAANSEIDMIHTELSCGVSHVD